MGGAHDTLESALQTTQQLAEVRHHRTAEVEQWRQVSAAAAERYGTPCYISRWRPVAEAVRAFDALNRAAPPEITLRSWLSFKTHPLPALARRWLQSGRGVEVVSEPELALVQRLTPSSDQLLVNGVAKHAWLHRWRIPRLQVHIDSRSELAALLPLALQYSWRLGVRVHAPDERDARDTRYGGQFGMTRAEAVTSLRQMRDAGADVQSMHFHLGQAPQAGESYLRAVEQLLGVCEEAEFRPRILDLGGGHPPIGDANWDLRGLRAAVEIACALFAPELQQIWLENGRALTHASSALAVRVLDIKERADSRYLICDGGRTNQALAADRGLHQLLNLPARSGAARPTTICGPTCMTDDTLGRLDLPGDLSVGDVLVWMHAGAYHLPWETRFSQGLCAVVWCDDEDQMCLARDHESASTWGHAWNL